LVKEYFKDSFIFYKPKDIVAGDFYWMEIPEKNNISGSENVIFAVADCTGHGVPGALVSIVCHNALNRAVREFGFTEPGKILDKTKQLVISEFEKSEEGVMDGMDISLCSLNVDKKQLLWSGANNPLWLIRNNELIEIKPNKQPIGLFERAVPFTTHKLDYQTNDCIYIFTDGFQDQFGGPRGKKFKTAKFKSLLISISSSPMKKQHELIENAFETWKRDLEQLDDICVMGIRL
jgi:serine phosphatase RsbU (regulator of sigma subunit)